MRFIEQKRDRAHPAILTQSVERYLNEKIRPRDAALSELEKDAVRNDVPISGPLIGSTLSILARIFRAKDVLEIGTATGYSGIWLARAIQEVNSNGKLTTIEMDPERKKIAEKAFEKARIRKKNFEIILGDASKVVPRIANTSVGHFDMVFIDLSDKTHYLELFDDCLKVLKKGGLFVADDTLYRGVARPSVKSRKTRIMRKFNDRLMRNMKLDPVVTLPVGDGLTIAIKKK